MQIYQTSNKKTPCSNAANKRHYNANKNATKSDQDERAGENDVGNGVQLLGTDQNHLVEDLEQSLKAGKICE
jgi:hypothetical protein